MSTLATKTTEPRRNDLDAMKGLGILCVVTGHFIEYYRGAAPWLNALFTCIYLFHMALFCTASGAVARFSLKKLITQQLWLYLVSQVGMLLFRVIALKEDLAREGGVLLNLITPWRHMWYLYALMFWMLTVPLLGMARQKGGGVRLAAFAVSVAVGLAGGLVDWPLSLGRVFSFFPFYAFGFLYSQTLEDWQHSGSRRFVLAAVVGLFYVFAALKIVTADPMVYEGARIFEADSYAVGGYTMADRAVFILIGIATTVALAGLVGGSRALANLGRRTLPVYILHMPIYALLVQLGCYEASGSRGLGAICAWLCLMIPAVFALCTSRPVCLVMDGIANFWYKKKSGLLTKKP
ncbi:acyltransferase family protein [Gemmiger sp.]|uniref:acyltransferase family protein n=1 Tax=Gemmiger sp. TaxID=2049027 RepID=UPI003EFDDC97